VFRKQVEDSFTESFYTHTSTSPNYQILSSLDVGRRQVEFEGYELVCKQISRALAIRELVNGNKEISKYFRVLTVEDLIPAEFRKVHSTYLPDKHGNYEYGFLSLHKAWKSDEFVLDPCRLTLYTGLAGIDGDTFKNKYLMDNYEIQVNKTSINSVLFMTTIGTTRSSVAYLVEALVKISKDLDIYRDEFSTVETHLLNQTLDKLTKHLPPLPNFSYFHPKFQRNPEDDTNEGIPRLAFFLGYKEEGCEYFLIKDKIWDDLKSSKRLYVAANFVTPYPPGFPILIPGQVITGDTIAFFRPLDVKEVHGYNAAYGIRVFKEETLEKYEPQTRMA